MMILPALSHAFSLGEVELRSHLGEPLNAKISINDTDTSIDATCFTVADISEVQAFRKATTTLNQAGGNLTLVITTQQIIAEPIVNLSLTYQCEPRVNREYVLLLDPAPITKAVSPGSTSQAVNDLSGNTRQNADVNQSKSASVVNKRDLKEDATTSAVEPPIKKPRAKKKKAKKATASMEEQLAAAYTGAPKNTSTNTGKPNAAPADNLSTAANKPYLVISGGSANVSENGNPANLALRLDRELNLNRLEITAVPLSNTEAMDEVTVMANRLAHLEKQILSLQSKNQKLQAEAAAEKAKNDGFLGSPFFFTKWLPYLGLGALLLLLLVALEAWRRKRLREQLDRHEAVWFDADAEASAEAELTPAGNFPSIEPKFSSDPLFGELASQSTVLTDADNEEAEGVLEHAEVFIAHGRTVLAIQLLQNHLMDFPTQSPHVWLKLLSLLANEGLETEYDVAVIECNQFFNIKLPSFAEANVADYSSIEDHPHIVDRLEGAWGSAFAITLLNDLIYNQHLQPREGFARGTFEELFFLKKIAEILQSSNPVEHRGSAHKSQPGKLSNVSEVALVAAIVAADESMLLESTPDRLRTGDSKDADVHLPEVSIDAYPQTEAVQHDEPIFDVGIATDGDQGHHPITDFITSNPDDFQTSEIDYALPTEEVDALNGDDMAPVIEHLDDITFSGDFTEALQFDQEDLVADEEAPVTDIKKDSNVIEFDWDLPKIHKD